MPYINNCLNCLYMLVYIFSLIGNYEQQGYIIIGSVSFVLRKLVNNDSTSLTYSWGRHLLINLIKLFKMLISTYQPINLIDRATWHFLRNIKNNLKRKNIWSINTCKQTGNIYSTSRHYRHQYFVWKLSIFSTTISKHLAVLYPRKWKCLEGKSNEISQTLLN